MNYWLGVIGTWLIADGLASIVLYYGKPSYRGTAQSWGRDHSIRLMRVALGVALVVLGWLIGRG